MTGLLDEGRAVNVVYLNFGKAFSTAFVNILIDKVMKCVLGKWTVKVDWKLAELLGSKVCDQWHRVQLEASIPNLDAGSSPI